MTTRATLECRLAEAVASRKAARTANEFIGLLARERVCRRWLAEAEYREVLHPRGRGGRWIEVLGKLKGLEPGRTRVIEGHRVRRDSDGMGYRARPKDAPRSEPLVFVNPEHMADAITNQGTAAPEVGRVALGGDWGGNTDAQREVQDLANSLSRRYNVALRSVDIDPLADDLNQLGGKSKDAIRLSPRFVDDDWMKARTKEFKGAQITVPNDPLGRRAIVMHEFGHVMDTALGPAGRKELDDFLNEPGSYGMAGTRARIQAGLEAPSAYGSTNRFEFVAEALADWIGNGDKAKPNSQRIGRIFDKHLGREPDITPITADETRGNSRAVSADEFQSLAQEGRQRLGSMRQHQSPPKGLDDNWDDIKASGYRAAQESWGGATIDAHTGEAVASDANKYALTVKPPGVETVSIPQDATQGEFNAAMDKARRQFESELRNEQHCLGIFHDDDKGTIDIDPVLVVDNLHDVETIGAYTHNIGGAYCFADGNGYWPPHVAEPTEPKTRPLAASALTAEIERTKQSTPKNTKAHRENLARNAAMDTVQQKTILRQNKVARKVRSLYPAGTRVTTGKMDGTVKRHVPASNAQGGHLTVDWDNGTTGRIGPLALTQDGGGRLDDPLVRRRLGRD